ncbi:hypothetical protein [Solimonas soli]|uniref:hypothetical protein n=1 Tax=Solimonas soli TaxID=413479 RepID=UPI000481F155|nr:hypothetical protein [Solimonas soli]
MNNPDYASTLARAPVAGLAPHATQDPANWILGPRRDLLFIIAAPVLVFALALALFGWRGAATATSMILLTHVIMTVAHHLPTFIRVYGDVELFRRHRWTFLLAPLIPFGFAMAVLSYINLRGYPVENALYLFIILALWDPWHFLMQHYGFTRIYDRHCGAPPRLAARMDLLLSASCFIAIMLLCGDWLPSILEDLYTTADLPLVFAVPPGLPAALEKLAVAVALLSAGAYAVYLLRCWHRGWRVSRVKLALYASFFAVMYLAYTPNAWMREWAPGWTFKVGFAVVGIVHMTQYLAIVWHYNRNLARRQGRARPGPFARLHARGGPWIGAGYVLLCLAYGSLLSGRHDARWPMSVLLALGFTSTLLHYYFDGFIWKVRHQQNRENLDMPQASSGGEASWWFDGRPRAAAAVLLRQSLYFGLPMLVLTVGAIAVWQHPNAGYVGYMVQAHVLNEQGRGAEATRMAEQALAAMKRQLPLTQRLAELQPTASREAALAFLLHDRARYERLLIPALKGEAVTADDRRRYRQDVGRAAAWLEHALQQRGSPAHAGRERMTADDARRVLEAWRREATAIED